MNDKRAKPAKPGQSAARRIVLKHSGASPSHIGGQLRIGQRHIGDSITFPSFRPLELLQVDCWDVPIYIVHPITRHTIGRPKLLQGTDIKSRVIPTWALTLDHEDSIAVPLLLEHLVADKLLLSKYLGIDCEPEWWPCQGYLCNTLLWEAGPLFREHAAFLKQTLGVEVLHAEASYLKPIQETRFDDLYQCLIRNLPGAFPPSTISPMILWHNMHGEPLHSTSSSSKH